MGIHATCSRDLRSILYAGVFNKRFFYNFFGENIPAKYRDWVSVSIKKDGTTIPKLEEMVELNYKASTCEYSRLIDSLKERDAFDGACHTIVRKLMKV